jgi:hypothetical protein
MSSRFPAVTRKARARTRGQAASDLTTMFFGRYLPPENLPYLRDAIPPTLVPPPQLSLTPEQEFYAGDYLNTLPGLEGDPQCSASITEVVN